MTDKELLVEANSIVNKWKETDIFKGVRVRRDNRISAQGKIEFNKKLISINLKKIQSLHSLRLTVLHELGHIYHQNNELNENDEYLAHRFALDTLRVFYQESYIYALECLRMTVESTNFSQDRPEHYEGFKRLYDEVQGDLEAETSK